MIITNSFAQLELKGIVVEEKTNDPLPGVNIIEENTKNIAFTGFNGKFRITVSDTATIRISSSSYLDKIIKANKYKRDTIRLKRDSTAKLVYFRCPNSYTFFGYFGDLIKYPYGFSLYHKRSRLFGKLVGLSGQINYKTDIKSNYDLKFILKKNNLISKNQFRLSTIASFQKRKYQGLNINDYEFILENNFIGRINLLFGYALKKNFSEPNKLNNGALIGISKHIRKTLTNISSNLKIFKNFNEYNIAILQGISENKSFWRNLKFGVEYRHYQDYNEYNFVVRYGFYK